jgi:hypothetical protein
MVVSEDRLLLIGDIRQHQGVDAGKPFEQSQEAGMTTSRPDQIMRQKDTGLHQAVEQLSTGETVRAAHLLLEQGRVQELPERAEVAEPRDETQITPCCAGRVVAAVELLEHHFEKTGHSVLPPVTHKLSRPQKLLVSRHCSDRGACGFVLTAFRL